MTYNRGSSLHVRISNRGIMEQFFPSVGKISHPEKRKTKNIKGHFKNTEHKLFTGKLITPAKYRK